MFTIFFSRIYGKLLAELDVVYKPLDCIRDDHGFLSNNSKLSLPSSIISGIASVTIDITGSSQTKASIIMFGVMPLSPLEAVVTQDSTKITAAK